MEYRSNFNVYFDDNIREYDLRIVRLCAYTLIRLYARKQTGGSRHSGSLIGSCYALILPALLPRATRECTGCTFTQTWPAKNPVLQTGFLQLLRQPECQPTSRLVHMSFLASSSFLHGCVLAVCMQNGERSDSLDSLFSIYLLYCLSVGLKSLPDPIWSSSEAGCQRLLRHKASFADGLCPA